MTKFDSRGNETYYEGDLSDAAFKDLELQLNHPTCFVARSVYEEHGAFDTWFEIGADRELMLRLYNAGIPRIHVDKTLARFRLGGATSNSTFRDVIWLTWQNWVMYRRHGVSVRRSLQRVVYKLLRRLAKSVLPLERLREIKESLQGTFIFQIVWGDRKPNSKSSL
jgi:hypothetical protein